jgi:hypothetical protein
MKLFASKEDHHQLHSVILSGAAWGPNKVGVSEAKDLLLFSLRAKRTATPEDHL